MHGTVHSSLSSLCVLAGMNKANSTWVRVTTLGLRLSAWRMLLMLLSMSHRERRISFSTSDISKLSPVKVQVKL